jgi:hypothetical protein
MINEDRYRKTKVTCFSHSWKIGPNDKCIHKYKHDHTYISTQNMFPLVELFERKRGKREGKRE